MLASVHALGLATAFAPDYCATMEALAELRSAYFRNARFIGSDFNPQICAFRAREEIEDVQARITDLIREALEDFAAQLSAPDPAAFRAGEPLDMILALPEIDAPGLGGISKACAEALKTEIPALIFARLKADFAIEPARAKVVFGGQAALMHGLESWKHAPNPGALLLIGVDSYSDRARLNALVSAGRLFSDTAQFGLVPGEAAGIALCRPNGAAGAHPPLAYLLSSGASMEPVGEMAGADSVFSGLSEACHSAVDALPKETQISHWISDWNNGRYRASEISYAMQRLGARLNDGIAPSPPALGFGDCGAAYPFVAIAQALEEMRNTEERALISASSSGANSRGALILARAANAAQKPVTDNVEDRTLIADLSGLAI
ncbi:MAG: hypothetical protein ACRBBK_00095 [Paracoccaceae bacterium]